MNNITSKIIFFFLDGFGLGTSDKNNPLWYAAMPFLRDLLTGPLVAGREIDEPGLLLKGIDACLGVEGIPQSATGQTALFTGVNAPLDLGYHLTAYPNDRLIEILNEQSVLKRALEKGASATFANAYDVDRYMSMVDQGRIRHSATTIAVMGAGLPFRTVEDLRKGEAVYWDISSRTLIGMETTDLALVGGRTAGKRLVDLTDSNDLVLYECFMPDILGHRRKQDKILDFLALLDQFFEGIITTLDYTEGPVTLVMSSDHGNIEDMTTGGHTKNPVPLLAVGPEAGMFRTARAITDPVGIILDLLSQETKIG
ncbi:MAG: phosphoglyceromutase [bacterium]|nr:phosphoglyceromutase [bacterium]